MIKYLELPGNAFLYPLVIILNKWLRLRLYFSPSFNRLDKKEDITVVVGVKDIDSKSLANCLKSIRGQFYDQSLVEIALVDYDSKEESIPLYKELCIKFQVKYIRVDNRPIWSRSNALNIGIKRAKTKYILTMDADLIFENNYIKEVVKELNAKNSEVE